MKFIFTITFVVILGNAYVSSAASTATVSSELSSVSSSISTADRSTTKISTETSTETTEMTTTTETSSSELATDAMSSSETTRMASSSTTTTDEGTTSTQIESTVSDSKTSTSSSETSSESLNSTLHLSSTSFQTTTVDNLITSTVTHSSERSPSTETSQSSTSQSSGSVSDKSTTAPETTTATVTTKQVNMTTEKTTPDESTTDETTPEGTTTEESTSTSSTTLPPTTTSHPTTTTVYNIYDQIIVSTENAVIPLSVEVTFKDCVNENDALANLTVEILKLDIGKAAVIESADSFCNNTSKTIIFLVHVLARSLLKEGIQTTIENISAAINNTGSVDTVKALASSSITACNSIICQQALVQHKGFNCESNEKYDCNLTSPCRYNGPCSVEQGSCYVQANGTHYLGLCKCTDDDMYSYSGSKCESKAYSWKLWTIIASGVGGGIIVILLFVVVIQCARKKAGSSNQKYGYDSGFDDRENLMYDRRYVTPDEYHRKPLPKGEDSADQVNLQSFENRGYDHWEPSDSKDTYASMDRHFQDPTFHAQISRPKLTTNKYGTDQLTPF